MVMSHRDGGDHDGDDGDDHDGGDHDGDDGGDHDGGDHDGDDWTILDWTILSMVVNREGGEL